jgi:hypothetical protein
LAPPVSVSLVVALEQIICQNARIFRASPEASPYNQRNLCKFPDVNGTSWVVHNKLVIDDRMECLVSRSIAGGIFGHLSTQQIPDRNVQCGRARGILGISKCADTCITQAGHLFLGGSSSAPSCLCVKVEQRLGYTSQHSSRRSTKTN